MTDEQRARYEQARAEAQAVYDRCMAETAAIVTRAREPNRPAPRLTLWQRFRVWLHSIRRAA